MKRATMGAALVGPPDPAFEPPEDKSFISEVCALPAVKWAFTGLGSLYNNVKERNSVTKMACEAGENTLNMATSNIRPLIHAVGPLECAVATLDHVACETLAKVEEKFPVVTKTPEQITETVTTTATECFDKVLNCTEFMIDMALPIDGTCKEDMKELEASEDNKGIIVRTKMLTQRLVRRTKTKLMSYKSVELNVDAVTSVCVAGKKVFRAYMYIPCKAIKLSGIVIVSTTGCVVDFTKAHNVQDMPAAVLNMTLKASEPLVAYVYLHNPAAMDYMLSSRLVQWMIPPNIVTAEDMDIILEEIEDEHAEPGEDIEHEDGGS